MKLKNVLMLAFLVLTFIPIAIVSLLLYKSGHDLSKESYSRNLIESINVQADYISQTIENNMISDYRFANKNFGPYSGLNNSLETQKEDLLAAFRFYLESSEDKISVGILLDKNDTPIYSIGEKIVLDTVTLQLPKLSELKGQLIQEFNLEQDAHSLGIITPIRNADEEYVGSLISIYDKSHIFKIISSYYEIADTSTYICRENGDVINYRGLLDEESNTAIEEVLKELTFTEEGMIDKSVAGVSLTGYYKNIYNSPWYLVGFVDHSLISSFTNQFVLVYIVVIIGVFIADVILAFYFSHKVVEPINGLIKVMEGYQNSLNSNDLQFHERNGYYETKYLRTKFMSLMKTILLVQHNFEGVYQLYQSSAMDDTNIDIDVKDQTIHSNKEIFEKLMNHLELSKDACIIERFTKCFCEKDQIMLMEMFENMRDEHLSVTCEAEIFTPYLSKKWFHSLVVPMYEDDRLSRLFIQLRDISAYKKQELESSEQARRDALTHLYNRYGFTECIDKVLQAGLSSDIHGLLFIDMNYFKLVNDNLGHSEGDDLLRTIGQTIQDAINGDDIAARLGGDEFVVFLPDASTEKIMEMKDKLHRRLIYPFDTEKASFVVSASIGISVWNSASCNTLEKMLQQADEDMYQTKRKFKER